MKKIKIKLILTTIHNAKHQFSLSIPDHSITIDEFIKPLYELCDFIIDLELSHTSSSCKKRCSVCCNQLIPLASGEIIHLFNVQNSLPGLRQKEIETKIKHITGKVEKNKKTKQNNISFDNYYFQLGLPCPFLENDACSIYSQRPFVCREYHVRSSPLKCVNPYLENPVRVAKGINLGALVTVFCARLFGFSNLPIPLFHYIEWTSFHLYLKDKTFSSQWLFGNFLDGLSRAQFNQSLILSISWSYEPLEKLGSNNQIDHNEPGLFTLLAENNYKRNKERIHALIKEGAAINNGSIFAPTQLPKRLTESADAENIKSIFTFLKEKGLCNYENEVFIEIGAGDGYLKYLLSLSDDSTMNSISEKIIETEQSSKAVQDNLLKGKHTLESGIDKLVNYFGSNFTPLIISMNVLDIFSKEVLIIHLKTLSSVLKKDGVVLHIMSSSIHAAVFLDIVDVYPDKFYLPYQHDGYIGIRIAQSHNNLKGLYPAADQPELLAQLFQQSPDKYIKFADAISNWFTQYNQPSDCVLLYEHSLRKLSKVMKKCNYNIIYSEIRHAGKRVDSSEFHTQVHGVNSFHNALGALVTGQETLDEGLVHEGSTFAVLIGQVLK